MTCPALLRRRPEATELVGDPSHGPLHPVGDMTHVAGERLGRDDTLGQFLRFVLVGGSSTALYAALFLGLGDSATCRRTSSRPWPRRSSPTSCTVG
ncbi:hypothetical protein [Blastococcus brunescens]|uniref:Uncharacterized protein n=1 Tax=Blastococcus brunescens TaxID=1564165 RepID=A0ABZ1B0K2_9ACTN|nr:hypothetical protein [Blastococcus sp. BMG 8361]WRL63286.1 hypothetical protein U6N30_26560 [Blastococcus sp. BMG 8361]